MPDIRMKHAREEGGQPGARHAAPQKGPSGTVAPPAEKTTRWRNPAPPGGRGHGKLSLLEMSRASRGEGWGSGIFAVSLLCLRWSKLQRVCVYVKGCHTPIWRGILFSECSHSCTLVRSL
eukprot:2246636-Pyramimonas_sp.AAC.1